MTIPFEIKLGMKLATFIYEYTNHQILQFQLKATLIFHKMESATQFQAAFSCCLSSAITKSVSTFCMTIQLLTLPWSPCSSEQTHTCSLEVSLQILQRFCVQAGAQHGQHLKAQGGHRCQQWNMKTKMLWAERVNCTLTLSNFIWAASTPQYMQPIEFETSISYYQVWTVSFLNGMFKHIAKLSAVEIRPF